MTASEDPVRRLARERGRLLGELGVTPADERWAKQEAEVLASLSYPQLSARLPGALLVLWNRLRRLLR
jgi:hypothetical protein